MKFNALRCAAGALLLVLISQTGMMISANWAGSAPVASKELGLAMEWMLRRTEAGESIVRRLTGITDLTLSDAAYHSFKERLLWNSSRDFATELRAEARKLEAELEEFRVSKGRPAKPAEGEALSEEDVEFLSTRSGNLRSNRIENLLLERITFVDAYVGPRDKVPANYRNGRKELITEVSTQDGEVPARPDPRQRAFDPDATRNTRAMQLAWWNKMWIRFRATRKFVSAVTLGEGDWRNLFIKSGKPFTAKDLANVRKQARLLDTINDYSEMRLIIQAFANEPREAVNELLHAMAGVPFKSVDKYVEIAREKGKDLPLNDVVYEALRRMLNVLERCSSLTVELNRAETNVWKQDAAITDAEHLMAVALKAGKPSEYNLHLGDRDLALQRRDKAAHILDDKSLDFVKNRDQVEIFANLREGLVVSESVAPIDLPEVLTVSQSQVDLWAPLYERALGRSTNALIKGELTHTARAQIGKTRAIVRELNQLTKQVNGRAFTTTQAGKHLEDYAQRQIIRVIIRVAKILGVTVPSAEVIRIAQEKAPQYIEQLKKVVGIFNGEGTTAPGQSAPSSSTQPSGGAAAAGSSAPGGGAPAAPSVAPQSDPAADPMGNPFGANPFSE